MKQEQYLLFLYETIRNANPETLSKSLNNVHANGMFSLVIGGTENGKLLRVFIAHEKLKPYDVQLHTHRYPINLTTIKGNIKHYLAVIENDQAYNTQKMSMFDYKSPLNGGVGLTYESDEEVKIREQHIPPGSTIHLGVNDFHTISCNKGSIWVVEELGFEKESSKVLGVPFITESLYTAPQQFQINDNYQLVKQELSRICNQYVF